MLIYDGLHYDALAVCRLSLPLSFYFVALYLCVCVCIDDGINYDYLYARYCGNTIFIVMT